MPRIRYTALAKADLIEIGDITLATWGESQYVRYLDSLDRALSLLMHHPRIGRAYSSPHPNWRRLPHGSHVILYSLDERGVIIRRILHKHQEAR
jgi:toxin ParE1/3/4